MVFLLILGIICQMNEREEVSLEEFLPFEFEKPVAMVENPIEDGIFYIAEQIGRVKVVFKENGNWKVKNFLDIRDRIDFGGEKGLLGIAFSPNFKSNGRIYISYTSKYGYSIISFFAVKDRKFSAGDRETIILKVRQPPFPNHKGGDIKFGPDGLLYISLGDGGGAGDPLKTGQNPKDLLGSILRIDPETELPYAIPKDNPFSDDVVCGVNQSKKPVRGCAEVFAFGLRNPWRFSFDRKTGALWAGDVGQNRWEEINIIERGKNYGWRCYEGFEIFDRNCSKTNFSFPVTVYKLYEQKDCAVIGGYVYRGEKIKLLHGKYLYGDWCSGKIRVLDAEKYYNLKLSDSSVLIESGLMVSSFAEDKSGEIYVLDHKSGKIYKITKKE
ncbi:Aldose sugar dehydrogenase YliI [bacterium HR19]|nr:Aldose sugar dehydrogenase YliI [bacterium HR19]